MSGKGENKGSTRSDRKQTAGEVHNGREVTERREWSEGGEKKRVLKRITSSVY